MKVVADIGSNEYYCHAAIVEIQEAIENKNTSLIDGHIRKAIQLLTLARVNNGL